MLFCAYVIHFCFVLCWKHKHICDPDVKEQALVSWRHVTRLNEKKKRSQFFLYVIQYTLTHSLKRKKERMKMKMKMKKEDTLLFNSKRFMTMHTEEMLRV